MTDKIRLNQLPQNAVFVIRGKVAFSRIASFIDGKELQEANARDVLYKRMPAQKPYTTINLHDAQVVCKDPANPTLEETYAMQSLYVSAKSPELNNQYEKRNSGKYLPKVYVIDPETKQYNQIQNTRELARDLDVSLVCRVYASGANKGVSLDSILVNEPIRYFEANANPVLAQLGIVLNSDSSISQEPTEKEEKVNETEAIPQMAITSPYAQQAQPQESPFGQAGIQPPAQPTLENPWG